MKYIDSIDSLEPLTEDDKIVVLGDVDTGKSTIIKEFLRENPRFGLIDLDVGQKDLGLPTTISGGRLIRNQLVEEYSWFIGDITPVGNLLQIMEGLEKIIQHFKPPWIVNTTGLVKGDVGIVLKKTIIDLIQPTKLILLERHDELEYFKQWENIGVEVIKLKVPKEAKSKSLSSRQQYRERLFKKYFKHSKLVQISWVDKIVENMFFHLGKSIELTKFTSNVDHDTILSARILGDTLYILALTTRQLDRETLFFDPVIKKVVIHSLEYLRNSLVAACDKTGFIKFLAILEDINFTDQTFVLHSPTADLSDVKRIKFSKFRLALDGMQLPRYKKRLLEQSIRDLLV